MFFLKKLVPCTRMWFSTLSSHPTLRVMGLLGREIATPATESKWVTLDLSPTCFCLRFV